MKQEQFKAKVIVITGASQVRKSNSVGFLKQGAKLILLA